RGCGSLPPRVRGRSGVAGAPDRRPKRSSTLVEYPTPLTCRTDVLRCERPFDTAFLGEHTNGRAECVRGWSCPSHTPRAGGVRLADAAARVLTARASPPVPTDGRAGRAERNGRLDRERARRIASVSPQEMKARAGAI